MEKRNRKKEDMVEYLKKAGKWKELTGLLKTSSYHTNK